MIKAVILVGGRGLRLSPITNSIPKPMIRIGEKPFLQYLLEMLSRNKICDIVLCVGYLKEKIIDYFGDGSRFGLRIEYSKENDFLGTGGALKMAKSLLTTDFILLYGDSYLSIDYVKLVSFWFRCQAKVLVVCYDNNQKIALNNISLDDSCFITAYNKRVSDKSMNYVDAGVILFKKEIVENIPDNKFISLEEEIFPELIKQRYLMGYPTDQRFIDIGTPQGLKEIMRVLI